MLAMQEILHINVNGEQTSVITSMEAANKKSNSLEKYICYDPETKMTEHIEDPSDSYSVLEADGKVCFSEVLPREVLVTGFWYELCNEIQTSYVECHK